MRRLGETSSLTSCARSSSAQRGRKTCGRCPKAEGARKSASSTPLSPSLSLTISAAGACPTLLAANPPRLLQHSCCCCCCCCANCMQFRVMFKCLLSCQVDPSGRVPRVLMMLHWRLVAYVPSLSAASRQHLIMKKAASSVIWHTLRIRRI